MRHPRVIIIASISSTLMLGWACSEDRASTPGSALPGADSLALEPELLDQAEQILAPEEAEPQAQGNAGPALAVQELDSIVPAEAQKIELLPGVVWAVQTGLKQEPAELGTWNAALTRGQRLRVVKGSQTETGFVRVILPDDSSGFVLAEDVLTGDIEELFAFEDSPIYTEPGAAQPKATLPIGTPLFVIDSQDGWVQVMLPAGEKGYMRPSDLARDPDELSAARS